MLPQLRSLTEAARPEALRRFVEQTFNDLTRLLGYLDAVDAAAASGRDAGPLFSIIQGEALSLSASVEAARSEEYLAGPLAEALESAPFAIRHELKDTGVTVTCLMPGATETDFFERADMMDTKIGRSKKDDAADVAESGGWSSSPCRRAARKPATSDSAISPSPRTPAASRYSVYRRRSRR